MLEVVLRQILEVVEVVLVLQVLSQAHLLNTQVAVEVVEQIQVVEVE